MVEHKHGEIVERVERLEVSAEVLRDELRGLKRDLVRVPPEPPCVAVSEMPRPVLKRTTPMSGRVHGFPSTASRAADPEPVADVPADEGSERRRFALPFDLMDLGDFRSGEWWLGRIGIALLLLVVAFLYLLSEERGWITPPMRVLFGLALGATLVVLGLRAYAERRSFARVLLGGSIGAFYATGYASYAFYDLVPHLVAFAFMAVVTALAFSLSVRQDGVALALIGTLGGLGTPFVLDDGSGSLAGLVLYACTVLAGACAVYFYKGWVPLLAVALVGGWSVFSTGLLDVADTGDRYALQLGITLAWLLFWLAPALRETLLSRGSTSLFRPGYARFGPLRMAQLSSAATPLLALALTQAVWSFGEATLGLLALVAAAAHALAALALGRLEGERAPRAISYTQALVASMLLTLALVLVLNGDALLFALAAEAAVLHAVSRRLRDRLISSGAHLLWAAVGLWVLVRVLPAAILEPHPQAFANAASFTDLAVVALALWASRVMMPDSTVSPYRIVAHGLALGWLAGELLPLADGDTWTLLAWALYAAVLHFLSRRHPGWGFGYGTHAFSAGIALWLGARLLGGAAPPGLPAPPVFNLPGLADLTVIALLALAALLPGAVSPRRFADAYGITAHSAFLTWTWRELSTLPGGEAYVTVAWGFYAVVLLVAGLRLGRVPAGRITLFKGGMTTLFLVVGKLFLVDLASIDASWRVLLFLGFGALFLALSYGLRALWRPDPDEDPSHRSDAAGELP